MATPLGAWDIALVAAVSLQATAVAYLHRPKWKAFLLTIPMPFTLATMALGVPVNATHVTALLVLFLFTQAVRLLHRRWGVPIVPAIVVSAVGYCLVGAALVRVLPPAAWAFWAAAAAAFLAALALCRLMPHRIEPGHRSPLPVWKKVPIIVAVILCIVLLKQSLGGFMTMFPMVGVVAAYEARHSLWSLGRQIPIFMLAAVPMMMASRLSWESVGLGPSLILGWAVYLAILPPLMRVMWARPGAADAAAPAADP